MKQATTCLNFDGNCRLAMQFHQKCLGIEIQMTPLFALAMKPKDK